MSSSPFFSKGKSEEPSKVDDDPTLMNVILLGAPSLGTSTLAPLIRDARRKYIRNEKMVKVVWRFAVRGSSFPRVFLFESGRCGLQLSLFHRPRDIFLYSLSLILSLDETLHPGRGSQAPTSSREVQFKGSPIAFETKLHHDKEIKNLTSTSSKDSKNIK